MKRAVVLTGDPSDAEGKPEGILLSRGMRE